MEKKNKEPNKCLICHRRLYEDSFWYEGQRYTNHPILICLRCIEEGERK